MHSPRPSGPLIHTTPIICQLAILTISDIFKLQTIFVYNCVNLSAPNQFSDLFPLTESNYSTETSRKELLKVPRDRTTNHGLNSIKNTGVRIWNVIPIDILKERNIKTFAQKTKIHFLCSYNEHLISLHS